MINILLLTMLEKNKILMKEEKNEIKKNRIFRQTE